MALAYRANDALPPRYSIHEKIGTGPMQPCPDYPHSTILSRICRNWLDNRAAYWERRGYQVEWPSDWADWFIAKKSGQPTVFVTLQKHQPHIDESVDLFTGA